MRCTPRALRTKRTGQPPSRCSARSSSYWSVTPRFAYEQIANLLGTRPDDVRKALEKLRERGLVAVVAVGRPEGHTTRAVSYWVLTGAGREELARELVRTRFLFTDLAPPPRPRIACQGCSRGEHRAGWVGRARKRPARASKSSASRRSFASSGYSRRNSSSSTFRRKSRVLVTVRGTPAALLGRICGFSHRFSDSVTRPYRGGLPRVPHRQCPLPI